MYPELFRIGSFPVATFGLISAVSFLLTLNLILKRSVRYGIDPDKMSDLCFWGLLIGILGARIWFLVDARDYYFQHPEKMLTLRFEGLTSFGGLVGGIFAISIWLYRTNYRIIPVLDTIFPSSVFGLGFCRLACIFHGCCYGVESTGLPWGIYLHNAVRHPTQLYDLFITCGFIVALWVYEKVCCKNGLLPLGVPLSWSLVAYGAGRIVSECWRVNDDESMTIVMGYIVSYAQVYAALMIVAGLIGVIYFYKQNNYVEGVE